MAMATAVEEVKIWQEENEEEVEEESGSLRRHRLSKEEKLTEDAELENGDKEEATENVYYDENKGVTVASKIPYVQHKEYDGNALHGYLADGISLIKHEITNEQEDMSIRETKDLNVKNGLSSNYHSETYYRDITKSESEFEEHESITTTVKKVQLKAADFDLERILEEQETHDLYCPNCSSCITRRVILRKRKRTVGASKSDAPSKKVHEEKATTERLEHSYVTAEETAREDEQELDVFRCLSCFSFFIPTEGGFNIFHIFGKKEAAPVQSSIQEPERKVNWFSSIFQSDSSKKTVYEQASSTEEQLDSQAQYKSSTPTGQPSVTSFPQKIHTDISYVVTQSDAGNDVKNFVEVITNREHIIHRTEEIVVAPLLPAQIQIDVDPQIDQVSRQGTGVDVLKAIVYGGLLESIASLGVVASAAGAQTSTLNIVAIGVANLIGGLLVIIHDLFDLKAAHDKDTDRKEETAGQYWEKLGLRKNFVRHFFAAVTTYILVGLLPVAVYGFMWRKSDIKEYKMIAVAASSLVCISILAIGKAHVKQKRAYFQSLCYYLSLGFSASGLSYAIGLLINRLVQELGWFNQGTESPPASLMYRGFSAEAAPIWSS